MVVPDKNYGEKTPSLPPMVLETKVDSVYTQLEIVDYLRKQSRRGSSFFAIGVLIRSLVVFFDRLVLIPLSSSHLEQRPFVVTLLLLPFVFVVRDLDLRTRNHVDIVQEDLGWFLSQILPWNLAR